MSQLSEKKHPKKKIHSMQMSMAVDFSSETSQARRQWNSILKILRKGKMHSSKLLSEFILGNPDTKHV
jgi:hypothetical protein